MVTGVSLLQADQIRLVSAAPGRFLIVLLALTPKYNLVVLVKSISILARSPKVLYAKPLKYLLDLSCW